MFYTKTPKEPHTDFAEKTFGCKIKRTAAEEKTAFSSIIKNIAAEDDSDDIVVGIHQALSEIAAAQDVYKRQVMDFLTRFSLSSLENPFFINPGTVA